MQVRNVPRIEVAEQTGSYSGRRSLSAERRSYVSTNAGYTDEEFNLHVENSERLHSPTRETLPENNKEGGTPPLIINNDVELGEDLLQIFGNDPKEVGKSTFLLHSALCSRWDHILTCGLPDEDKRVLAERYKMPQNLPSLVPPEVNAEILAIMSPLHKKRDSGYITIQNQIAHSLSALGQSLNIFLEEGTNISKNIKEKLLTPLWDSGKNLANLFFNISQTRRILISQTLNRQVKEIIDKTSPDVFLFGSEFGEKIKSAKLLEKAGKDLLSTPAFTRTVNNVPNVNTSNTYTGGEKRGGRQSNTENRRRPVRQGRVARPYKGQQPSKYERFYSRKKK